MPPIVDAGRSRKPIQLRVPYAYRLAAYRDARTPVSSSARSRHRRLLLTRSGPLRGRKENQDCQGLLDVVKRWGHAPRHGENDPRGVQIPPAPLPLVTSAR
jgi:hypothetical protein